MTDVQTEEERQYLKLNWFQKGLAIPPLRLRPAPAPWITQFAMGGYDPENVESYILYRSFLLALWLFLGASFVYVLPVAFHIVPDFWGLTDQNPVEYFKEDFPKRISLPLIAICCVYAVVLSWKTRGQHNWSFSTIRPIYVMNVARAKSKRFPLVRLAYMHLVPLIGMGVACYYPNLFIEFLKLYRVTKLFHDFDAQTLLNFLVIWSIYGFSIFASVANGFAFIVLLAAEKLLKKSTGKLERINK